MVRKASKKSGAVAPPVPAVSHASPTADATASAPPPTGSGFPIIGIGSFAGGLEAFFRACPADSGMGFMLEPHLDPRHQSLLTEIRQRSTAMPVMEALDQIQVEPNHVCIIPPNREMAILHGMLLLSVPEQAEGR